MNLFIIAAIIGILFIAIFWMAAQACYDRGRIDWAWMCDGWCWTCVIATVILAIVGAFKLL